MPTPTELANAADISVPYASQILSGKRRPTLATAIAIHRKTGLQFGQLAGLTKEEVELLERIQVAV